jgi:hypothetical protein
MEKMSGEGACLITTGPGGSASQLHPGGRTRLSLQHHLLKRSISV